MHRCLLWMQCCHILIGVDIPVDIPWLHIHLLVPLSGTVQWTCSVLIAVAVWGWWLLTSANLFWMHLCCRILFPQTYRLDILVHCFGAADVRQTYWLVLLSILLYRGPSALLFPWIWFSHSGVDIVDILRMWHCCFPHYCCSHMGLIDAADSTADFCIDAVDVTWCCCCCSNTTVFPTLICTESCCCRIGRLVASVFRFFVGCRVSTASY